MKGRLDLTTGAPPSRPELARRGPSDGEVQDKIENGSPSQQQPPDEVPGDSDDGHEDELARLLLLSQELLQNVSDGEETGEVESPPAPPAPPACLQPRSTAA